MSAIPIIAQARISATIGKDQSAFYSHTEKNGIHFENSQQGLSASFTDKGADFQQGSSHWTVALTAYGHGSKLQAAESAAPQGITNRVEYHRGPVTEWYVNGPAGIEQGFTVARKIEGKKYQPLTLAMSLAGDYEISVDQDGHGLMLKRNGSAGLHYAGLTSIDARGQELPSRMKVVQGRLLITVDDHGAQYPVQIDPLLQAATLKASDGGDDDVLGWSVAVSKDGNTIAAGAPGPFVFVGHAPGKAYVFVKSGKTWADSTEVAQLTGSDTVLNDDFARSIAISGDGSVVVVGADRTDFGSNSHQGAVYVFIRPDRGWVSAQETVKLSASDGIVRGDFGISIALDDTGSTMVVGELGEGDISFFHGAGYVFVRPQTATGFGAFSQVAKLTNSDPIFDTSPDCVFCADNFGANVTISSDGNTAVIGAGSFNPSGAAYVYNKPANGWVDATESAKLTSSDASAQFGAGVAVSGDGSTIAVGAFQAPFPTGAIYVYERPGDAWASTANANAKLTASNNPNFLGFPSISSDGKTIMGTASTVSNSVYGFAKPGADWVSATEDARFTGSGRSPAVINGNGTVMVTGQLDAVQNGSGRVFVYTGSLGPDFSIGNVTRTVALGSSTSATVTVTSFNKFNSAVNMQVNGLPVGISASLNPASVTPATGGTATSQLNITVNPSIAAGTYTFTVTGTANDITHTATVTLTVQPTTDGIGGVITTITGAGCIDNSGISNALKSKLAQAQAEIASGQIQNAINTLTALLSQLFAQSGKHISGTCTVNGVTFNSSEVLIADVQSLLANLKTNGFVNPLLGYVVDATGKGVSGTTVGIFDAGNNLLGTLTTDSTGFYFLSQTDILTTGAAYTAKPAVATTPLSQTFQWQGAMTTLANFVIN